jgi:hypothetical protein
LTHIAGWSERACANQSAFKGAEELARLARHGIKPLDIVVETAACLSWLEQNPRVLPDDRSQDFAVSRAVFGLAPRARCSTRYRPVGARLLPNHSYARKARTGSLNYVGTYLRTTLAAFLANIALTLEARAMEEAARLAAMRAPLQLAMPL